MKYLLFIPILFIMGFFNQKEQLKTIEHEKELLSNIVQLKDIEIRKLQNNVATIQRQQELTLAQPLSEMYVTSYFGKRFHPILKCHRAHKGIDLRAKWDEVYAVQDGTIVKTINNPLGLGKAVYLRSNVDTALVYIYAHLSHVNVLEGDSIKRGALIAKSGNTGLSSSPHLHFEVKHNNKNINPNVIFNL